MQEISRRKPVIKNRVDPEIETKVVQMSFDQPAWGQARVSNELRKSGMFITPGGVRSIWLSMISNCFVSSQTEVRNIAADEKTMNINCTLH